MSSNGANTIKTFYKTLEFPDGVAVQELKNEHHHIRKEAAIPTSVELVLKQKNLHTEYASLMKDITNANLDNMGWKQNNHKLNAVVANHRPAFESKDGHGHIAIFLCGKLDYVNQGPVSHTVNVRWLEFVDRSIQPNYNPKSQQGSSGCTVS